MTDPNQLKTQILALTRQYSALVHSANRPGSDGDATGRLFVPGETTVPYAGRVFTEDEVKPQSPRRWTSGSRSGRRATRWSGNSAHS
jgi:hypothetical protein